MIRTLIRERGMPFEESVEDEIRRFEEQFRQQPESLVFARLADAYRKSGDLQRALEVLEEGIGRHPDYLSAHIVRARTFRDLGRSEEARSTFERVIEIDAQNLVAIRGLAEIARESGDVNSELAWLERLELADPQSRDSGSRLAELRAIRSATAESTADGSEAEELPEDPGGQEWWSDGPLASGEAGISPARQEAEVPAALDPADAAGDDPETVDPEPGLSELVAELWSGPAIHPVRGRVADSFAEELNAAILDSEPPQNPPATEGPPVADAWWFEPPAEPGDGEEGGGEPDDETDQDADLLTRTMAELYARQGLVDEAEAIYRELLADRPDDEALRSGLEAVLGMRAARGLRPSVGAGPDTGPASSPDLEPAGKPEVESEVEPRIAPEGETVADHLVRVLREGESLVTRIPAPPAEKSVLEAWLERLRG